MRVVVVGRGCVVCAASRKFYGRSPRLATRSPNTTNPASTKRRTQDFWHFDP
jgi:hypothetical protein